MLNNQTGLSADALAKASRHSLCVPLLINDSTTAVPVYDATKAFPLAKYATECEKLAEEVEEGSAVAVTFTVSTYESMVEADQGARYHSFNLQDVLLLARPSKDRNDYFECDEEDSAVGVIPPQEDDSSEVSDDSEDEDKGIAVVL